MKILAYGLLIVCLCVATQGCLMTKESSVEHVPIKNYKPLNVIQQEFYDVQTLYESGKFTEVVEMGSDFVKNYQRDVLTVAISYYVATSYQKLGKYTEAEKLYKKIIETNPDDEWGKLSVVGLQEIKEAQ